MTTKQKPSYFFSECSDLNLPIWQCPPFLFMIMGFVTIVSMIATYVFASRIVEEPQIAALIVIFVAAIFFVVGNIIIASFKKIADANRMKSEFISVASHQLRTPLSVIKWVIEASQRDLRKGMPVSDTVLASISQNTERMIGIVNNLLDVSRIEAGTFQLKKEEVNLSELARIVVRGLEQYAKASNITIELDAMENAPFVFGDRERILVVIQNLVDNAVRYSQGPNTVRVSLAQKGDYLECRVDDRGIGIASAEQKFLFQKFYRSQSGSRFQTSGTGIGLYIAKNIIQSLGGKIGFHSTKGKGSAFWFMLPIAPADNGN